MSRRLLVVPTGDGVGLTSICLGIVRALDRKGVRTGFLKPIRQLLTPDEAGRPDRSRTLFALTMGREPPEPIAQAEVERLLGLGDDAVLLEEVVARLHQVPDSDVIVIEGLVPNADTSYATQINVAMAKALDAELVFVDRPQHDDPTKIADTVDIAARAFGAVTGGQQRACILNWVPLQVEEHAATSLESEVSTERRTREEDVAPLTEALRREKLHPLGVIPVLEELNAPRVKELAEQLGAETINEGDWTGRRIERISICAATVRNAVEAFETGTLVITPGDREDIVMAASLAGHRGTKLAGLLLTNGFRPDPRILELCSRALDAGLPVLSVPSKSFETAVAVREMDRRIAPDDRERAELVMNTIANYLDADWLQGLAATKREQRVSAPAFRHQLIELSRAANKRIVLPEGDEPRTVEAAAICGNRGIARCALLGDPQKIRSVAQGRGVTLPDSVEIIDPLSVVEGYVAPMVELRKHKGLTEAAARDQLEDTVVLGTMMLKQGDVDGLVSGAVHTTANTIRPALQLIKTAKGASLVSSIFFMCLPEQVLVYGDCAVNPDPTAEQLADIALQSASSARAFGIEPRVAMISYSTGASGSGSEVEKVAQATAIARERSPELKIDGPLQYDAASVASVAAKKAPGSEVAGRATVFIFPDLNTGNTTYKAVQRSANVVSIGPMLQGLAKPVNDLSRGALVEDIVFTIALTAIQAHSDAV